MKGFFEKVYEAVGKIPPGYVATYGQIASLLDQPHNARVVGWAMRQAPADRNLPCHRVINKTGILAPAYAFGGREEQRALLEKEGVTFDEKGRVNVRKHIWDEELC